MKPKVDFFLVGMPRASTTSVSEYLREHPQIFMSSPKELNYFCKDLLIEYLDRHKPTPYSPRTRKQYEKLFERAGERLRGEASVWYLPSLNASEHIYNYNPDAKIIMLLREPTEWLQSTHAKYLSDLEETEEDLIKAISLEEERARGDNIPDRAIYPTHLQYTRTAKLYDNVLRFLNYFPRKQVKIIIFDDIKKDVKKVMKEIYSFLDVDEDFEPTIRVYNSNHHLARPTLFKIITARPMYYPYKFFEKIMPQKAYANIKRKVFGLVHTYEPRKKELTTEQRNFLKRKFKTQVTKLSVLLDRDLTTEWGYDNLS